MRLTVVNTNHAKRRLLSSFGPMIAERQIDLKKSRFINLELVDKEGNKIITLPYFIQSAMTKQLRWRDFCRVEILDAIEKHCPAYINVSLTHEPIMDVINFTHAMDQSVTSFDGKFALNCRRLILKNGGEMSVQASPGHYCSPRDMTDTMSYSYYREFEVGFPSFAVPEFSPYSQDSHIYGWVPDSVIQFVINRCGGTTIPVCEGNYSPKIHGHLKDLSKEIRQQQYYV